MTDTPNAGGAGKLVVLDTSVLLNFLRVGRLDLLVGLPGYELLVTDHVRAEVTEPAHAEVLREAVQGALRVRRFAFRPIPWITKRGDRREG